MDLRGRKLLQFCGLDDVEARRLLKISQSTYYRWIAENHVPHIPTLVLVSVARGLPVIPARSAMWEGWRFSPDGYLWSPGGWPTGPADLYELELLRINGFLTEARERQRKVTPEAVRGWRDG